jgi:5'(3')-deoxyribonucleotidase
MKYDFWQSWKSVWNTRYDWGSDYDPETGEGCMFNLEFWDRCSGVDFWSSMPMYAGADELYRRLCDLAPVTIVTHARLEDPGCVEGKRKWLHDNLGVPDDDMVFASKKWLLANENTLLIDDNDTNVCRFGGANGPAILYPRPWNWARGATNSVDQIVEWSDKILFNR